MSSIVRRAAAVLLLAATIPACSSSPKPSPAESPKPAPSATFSPVGAWQVDTECSVEHTTRLMMSQGTKISDAEKARSIQGFRNIFVMQQGLISDRPTTHVGEDGSIKVFDSQGLEIRRGTWTMSDRIVTFHYDADTMRPDPASPRFEVMNDNELAMVVRGYGSPAANLRHCLKRLTPKP